MSPQDSSQGLQSSCKHDKHSSTVERSSKSPGRHVDDVVEVGVLLADPTDFPGMNDEYGKWFPVNPPTRYTTKLGAVIPGVLISIRMIAITE
jgi:2-iminobutanoate/2-iminopropanoate deaminase